MRRNLQRRIINDLLDLCGFWFGIRTIILSMSIVHFLEKGLSGLNSSEKFDLENFIKSCPSQNPNFNDALNILMDDYFFLIYYFNTFTVFSFARLLKLSIVCRPLEVIVRSAKVVCFDLLKFSPFFLLVFFSFALFGLNVFGSFMENYKTLKLSIVTLIEIAFGELFYESFYEFNSVIGTVYFCAYVIVVFLICFNIFSAITNESFESVKSFLNSENQRWNVIADSAFIQRNFNLIINARLQKYEHNMRLVLTGKLKIAFK